jgi:hypothetical protein
MRAFLEEDESLVLTILIQLVLSQGEKAIPLISLFASLRPIASQLNKRGERTCECVPAL